MEGKLGFGGCAIICIAFLLIILVLITSIPIFEADAMFVLWLVVGLASVTCGIIVPAMVIAGVLISFHRVSDRARDRLRVILAFPFIVAEVVGIMSTWSYYLADPWPRVLRLGFAWIQGFKEIASYIR